MSNKELILLYIVIPRRTYSIALPPLSFCYLFAIICDEQAVESDLRTHDMCRNTFQCFRLNSSENCCCRSVRFIVSQLTYHAVQCNQSQQCCPKTFICTVFFSATVFLIIFVWYSVRILGHKWIHSFSKYVQGLCSPFTLYYGYSDHQLSSLL